MQKTSYVSYPVEECRKRLSNIGIGYTDTGNDVYRFNPVQKKGEDFSFYATVTLRSAGIEGTDVTLDLAPATDGVVPENENVIYDKFISRFFRLLSEPVADDFITDNPTTGAAKETKFCVRCGAKIDAKAVVCPKCGCSQKRDYMEDKTSAVGIAAIIFAVLGGWLGLILSLFGLLFYYTGDSEVDIKGKKNCKIALGIIAVLIITGVMIAIFSFIYAGAMMMSV